MLKASAPYNYNFKILIKARFGMNPITFAHERGHQRLLPCATWTDSSLMYKSLLDALALSSNKSAKALQKFFRKRKCFSAYDTHLRLFDTAMAVEISYFKSQQICNITREYFRDGIWRSGLMVS
jgi:hypothetical protein